jgi:uncharacterized membrane protein
VQVLRTIYRYWMALLFLAIIVQIGAAGYGAFYAADKSDPGPLHKEQFDHGFSFHGGFGSIIILAGIVALLIALGARMGKRTNVMALVLAVLLVIQQILASVGASTPAVGTLHPINAFLILGLTGQLAHEAWRGSRRPAAAAT